MLIAHTIVIIFVNCSLNYYIIDERNNYKLNKKYFLLHIEILKQPVQGKILIKDLKNSTIYNETVKAIENKKKAKAAKMEDGELSDSSSDNRTPTLSPTPPRDDLFRSPSFSPSRDRKKSRIHSPTRGTVPTKTDLRLVLREKEKKKLGVNDYKNDVSLKDTKDKNNKRSRSCHSQDRRRSRSRTRYSSHRSRSREREKRRDKSREKRDRSNEKRDSGRSRERRRYRSRSEDRSKEKYTRVRSRSRERKLVFYLIRIVIISIVINGDAELFVVYVILYFSQGADRN